MQDQVFGVPEFKGFDQSDRQRYFVCRVHVFSTFEGESHIKLKGHWNLYFQRIFVFEIDFFSRTEESFYK
jgi:hypothetical protein